MRKALSLVVKAAVSGLLLYLALRTVDLVSVKDRLSQIDLCWIGLGLPLLLVQVFVLAVRWRLIVIRCGANLPLAQAFRYSMIATFFNQTLPSSVGGDAVRIWLVGKQSNWRTATYSVLLDRVVGIVALAMFVVACLPWTLALIRNPVGRTALLMIGLGCIGAGLVFVGLAWERLRILQRWSLTRHVAAAAAIALSVLRSPQAFVPIFGLSFVIHLLTALAAWCAARAVRADLPFIYSIFLVLPVILIAVVPISIAGWGVREGAMVAAFGYAGLPPGDGLLVSLLFGAGYLVVGALGGLVWTFTTDRRAPGAGAILSEQAGLGARLDGNRDTI
jgi:glycosyltransferase 2 family protein